MKRILILLSCLAIVCCSGVQKDYLSGDGVVAYFYCDSATVDWVKSGHGELTAEIDSVSCTLLMMKSKKGMTSWRVTIRNDGNKAFIPRDKAGLKLGIDTYMDTYPEWFDKYFPTLACCEENHFYGYFQKPSGEILGLYSPDCVASWSVDYNRGYTDSYGNWFMGHRIEAFNLDLILNEEPLEAGGTRSWTFSYLTVSSLDKYEKEMFAAFEAPMLDIGQTCYSPGEQADITVLCKDVNSAEIKCWLEREGCIDRQAFSIREQTETSAQLCLDLAIPGLYHISVCDGEHSTKGTIAVHESWGRILTRARDAALKYNQKATSHCESWYGFYSAFEAAKYFPNRELDRKLDDRFEMVFRLLYDTEKLEPIYYSDRIQNTSTTIGQLTDRWEAFGRPQDLLRAGALADWLIGRYQKEDGAFVLPSGIVYTSVIYIAKSLMELATAEKAAGWLEDAERHFASAGRAVDQLVVANGNFETEGEMTFEDGMLSCSALQIGLWALMQQDKEVREHYTDAMLKILKSHDCLTQLTIPDARRRGGTMRYWEAQYDVLMLPNMFNSPHGWSAWRGYAAYYAYLLTGDEKWLEQAYNAAGAFSRLIDIESGSLYWAYVVDPRVSALQATVPDKDLTFDDISFGNPHPALYEARRRDAGGRYIEMVSDWQTVNTQDNDVHEIFKFIAETFLTNAFIIEKEDGSLRCFNCRAERTADGTISVIPDESQIGNLHCKLHNAATIIWIGRTITLDGNFMGWAFEDRRNRGPAEKPELERIVSQDNFALNDRTISIEEFLARPVFKGYIPTGDDYCILEGTISKIFDHEIGFIELSDDTGTIQIYGITATRCRSMQNDHSFSSLKLEEGSHVRIASLRRDYQGRPQGSGFIVN